MYNIEWMNVANMCKCVYKMLQQVETKYSAPHESKQTAPTFNSAELVSKGFCKFESANPVRSGPMQRLERQHTHFEDMTGHVQNIVLIQLRKYARLCQSIALFSLGCGSTVQQN